MRKVSSRALFSKLVEPHYHGRHSSIHRAQNILFTLLSQTNNSPKHYHPHIHHSHTSLFSFLSLHVFSIILVVVVVVVVVVLNGMELHQLLLLFVGFLDFILHVVGAAGCDSFYSTTISSSSTRRFQGTPTTTTTTNGRSDTQRTLELSASSGTA
jgi:hypothetical protein